MEMPELINRSVHTIDAEHYEEYASGRNWLKVSVCFVDKYQQPHRIISDCYIEKAEQIPKLTEKVLKVLYEEKRKGNTWT